jgi:uncharacterized protein (DUF433 family)
MSKLVEKTPGAAGLSYLSEGLYTLPEAAEVMIRPVTTLRSWVDGYYSTSTRGGGRPEPLLFRTDQRLITHGFLTFRDLIELVMVNKARHRRIPMWYIRQARRRLTELLRTSHPFSVQYFYVAGQQILAQVSTPKDGDFYEELAHRQLVIPELAGMFIDSASEFSADIDYADEIARHFWPLGKQRPLVMDPKRSFGQPIDPLTGVPSRVLYGAYAAGESAQAVAQWYEVAPEAVDAAIEYEQARAA